MGLILESLLDEAVAEVTSRDPAFLQGRPVGLDPTSSAASLFSRRGVTAEASGAQPLLARMLCESLADAAEADAGRLPLAPSPRRAFDAVLAGYDRRCVDGVDYLVRRGGSRPLVLVNAVGIPLHVWSRLLGDDRHDYRILVVAPAGSDLIDGGMRSDPGLHADVDRIERVLDAEGLDRFAVLGWCSGGRTAVELAARHGDKVETLVLLSTTFRGEGTDDARLTQFEEDIGAVLGSIQRNPTSADFLSTMLMKSQGAAPAPVEDGLLFRLPHRDHVAALAAPFVSGDVLRLYTARLASDRTHDIGEALARAKAPLHAITGAHDHILNNATTLALLRKHATSVSATEVSGAGHYAHDLQYPYFRMLLDDALTGRSPSPAARVRRV